MGKILQHGTARALGIVIEKEGFKPEGCSIVPKEFRKSCISEEGYIYFTDSAAIAEVFACGTAKKVGLGKKGQVFEIDTDDVKVEHDPLLPAHSFRHKGKIPSKKIKNSFIFDCKNGTPQ